MESKGKPAVRPGRFRAFLDRKHISITPRAYFLDAMSAMALGLFSSLLIGTIFGTIYNWTGWELLNTIATYAKGATGAALGVAIAYSLHAPSFVLFSAAAVGIAGNALGGPVGAYVAAVIATELGKAVSKETKVDLLVTPAVTIISGVLVAQFVGPGVSAIMNGFGAFIMRATELQPLWMGMIVSAVVGIVLTLPISSAALCVMLNLSGIAAGAATAGCCAQMVGFAVQSFRENRWNGLVAQGLGTSMLQVPNILKNPRIWIPTIVTSLITGPISTLIFRLENIPTGAGMGTCGLVGPLGILTAMPNGGVKMWLGIILICFVLPALLTPIFSWGLEKIGWIRPGDVKLDL
ncbi:MAG: PTS sugar transporter subunit IIC [Clostridiaceae bacterium]|nr:PTS sugar transporter subunit IIC [Clostridiaceae bacterium]